MNDILIAGNWKMHCGPAETKKLISGIKSRTDSSKNVEVLVCPPAISLTTAATIIEESDINLGAQNVYFEDNGAFTGEISTSMIKEVGCTHVIVGHSERREYFGETDATVNAKVKKALSDDLQPIVCVGESLQQRKKGVHQKMVKKQVHAALQDISEEKTGRVIFAYEPLWAIGTGETATPKQAQTMHGMIRDEIVSLYEKNTADQIFILYGGSMKPHNAESLLSEPDINGGLIGGASLKAESFSAIIDIAKKLTK